MSLKKVREFIEEKDDYKTSDVLNHEGFPAFKIKGKERLKELLFIGNLGNTFYVKQEQVVKEKVEDVERLINELEPDVSSKIIVSARQEGFFRHLPIIALIFLRKKSPEHFKRIFNEVVITGQDISDYLDLSRSLGIKWGSSAKKAMHKWLEERVSPFYAIKYRKQIADTIAISRPKIDKMSNSDLLKYAYKCKKIDSEVVIKNIQLESAEKFKEFIEAGNINEAVRCMEEGKLPADLSISLLGNSLDTKVWEAIAKNMGVTQFLKYLNKLASILPERILFPLVEQKVTIENLSKAKVFPYSIFVAWVNIENSMIKNHLERTMEQYVFKYDVDLWNKYSWFIAPDVSGSMRGQPAQIAGFFAGVLGKRTGNDYIYCWSTECNPMDIRNKSIVDVCNNVFNVSRGGTAMYAPIEFAIKNHINRDIFIIITDNEHWFGGTSFMSEWRKYKNSINRKAKAVVIEVVGYGHSQVNEEFAQRYDVYTVFGWSDSVFKWIEMKILEKD